MYIYIKPIFYFKKPNKRRVIRKDTQYGGNYAFKKKKLVSLKCAIS